MLLHIADRGKRKTDPVVYPAKHFTQCHVFLAPFRLPRAEVGPQPLCAWRILSHVREEACVPTSHSDLPLRCAHTTLTAVFPASEKLWYLQTFQSNQQCLKGIYFFKAKLKVTENFHKIVLKATVSFLNR